MAYILYGKMTESLLLDIILMFLLFSQLWIAVELNSIKNELRWFRWERTKEKKEKNL